MARTKMVMRGGAQIAQHLSIGILAKTYTHEKIQEILKREGLESQRVRDLPSDVLVYYIIALGLYMAVSTGEVLRSLVEGLQWLKLEEGGIAVAGRTGISKARSRLGPKPIKALWEESAQLLAQEEKGVGFYRGMRLMAIDGSTLDVADTEKNLEYFGKQDSSRGKSAYPQMRFVSLCECGTHSIYAVRMGVYKTAESSLAEELLNYLKPGMLCLADRLYATYPLWQKASSTGAELLWRVRSNALLPVEKVLKDGSYISTIYPSTKSRRNQSAGIAVRVIEYEVENTEDPQIYRLVTTLLDPEGASALELAALYQQRWEIEITLDEFKTHLRGGRVVLRSKTPDLVIQEFYGMMLAHRAVRTLMYQAAASRNIDPDRLSFTHSVRVIRRKLAATPAISPSRSGALDVCFTVRNPSRNSPSKKRPLFSQRGKAQNVSLSYS